MLDSTLPLAIGTDGPDLTRYAAVVGILVVGLCTIAVGIKRLVGVGLRTRAKARSLRIVEVLPLGGRRQLAIVRCYDRTFALGLGERNVSLVAELDPVEADPDGAVHGASPPAAARGARLAPTIGELAPFDEMLGEARRDYDRGGSNGLDMLIDDELEELVR